MRPQTQPFPEPLTKQKQQQQPQTNPLTKSAQGKEAVAA